MKRGLKGMKQRSQELWDSYKRCVTHDMGTLGRRESGEPEELLELAGECLPKFIKWETLEAIHTQNLHLGISCSNNMNTRYCEFFVIN